MFIHTAINMNASEQKRAVLIDSSAGFQSLEFTLPPSASKMLPGEKLRLILVWGEYSATSAGFSHKLAHKVENVPNPRQSYDIWSVA